MTKLSFANQRNLTDDDISRFAPSFFTNHAHPERTERYHHVSSAQVVETLREAGYNIMWAGTNRSRGAMNQTYGIHFLRARSIQQDDNTFGQAEIWYTNSHNGQTTMRFNPGFYPNGSRVPLMIGHGIVVRHAVGSLAGVQECIAEIVQSLPEMVQHISALSEKLFSRQQQLEIAKTALQARFGYRTPNFDAAVLLDSRYTGDNRVDGWSVYRRVVDNAIYGQMMAKTFPTTKSPMGKMRCVQSLRRIQAMTAVTAETWNTAVSLL